MSKANKEKTDVEEVKGEIGRFKALEAVGNSEGGKQIIKGALKNIDSSIATLAGMYKSASDSELRAACATLAANFELYNLLMGAKANRLTAMADLKELENGL